MREAGRTKVIQRQRDRQRDRQRQRQRQRQRELSLGAVDEHLTS